MFGTCDICGAEAERYPVGEMSLCEDCIEANYIACDHCNEYYTKDDTVFYYLKDGRVLCEDCAIYALNFSGLADDDIDRIIGEEDDEEEEYEEDEDME